MRLDSLGRRTAAVRPLVRAIPLQKFRLERPRLLVPVIGDRCDANGTCQHEAEERCPVAPQEELQGARRQVLRAILKPSELEHATRRHQQAVLAGRVALGDEPARQPVGAEPAGVRARLGGTGRALTRLRQRNQVVSVGSRRRRQQRAPQPRAALPRLRWPSSTVRRSPTPGAPPWHSDRHPVLRLSPAVTLVNKSGPR